MAANRLVVGSAEWTRQTPAWILREVASERLALGRRKELEDG